MRHEVITAILAQMQQGRMAQAERMATDQLRLDPQDAGAWSLAGVAGPGFVALVKDRTGSFAGALPVTAAACTYG